MGRRTWGSGSLEVAVAARRLQKMQHEPQRAPARRPLLFLEPR